MIDQGNLLSTGVGISKAFFKKMKLKYAKITKSNVKTAANGMGMTKLGLTEIFTLSIEGIKMIFDTQATVIKELSDDINIGAGFLQRAAARGILTQLDFHPDGTRLNMNKEAVNLVSKVMPEEDRPPIQQEKDPTETLEPDQNSQPGTP